jgi:hypothetical protein
MYQRILITLPGSILIIYVQCIARECATVKRIERPVQQSPLFRAKPHWHRYCSSVVVASQHNSL